MVEIFETCFVAAVSAVTFADCLLGVLAIVGTLWHFVFVWVYYHYSDADDALYH